MQYHFQSELQKLFSASSDFLTKHNFRKNVDLIQADPNIIDPSISNKAPGVEKNKILQFV